MKVRNYTIAGFQCPYCGNIEAKKLMLFEQPEAYQIHCSSCRKTVATLKLRRKGSYKLEITCIDCGDKHVYILPVKEFWHTTLKEFHCIGTEGPIFFIGTPEKVDNMINDCFYAGDLEERFDVDYNTFDDHAHRLDPFSSSDVLMKLIEHLENMAHENKIFCDCGEQYIQLNVEFGGLRLVCPHCKNELFLNVTTQTDINKLMSLDEIHLRKNDSNE